MAAAHNRGMVFKLIVIVAMMFGFGFLLVPIYRAVCSVTGINVLTKEDDDAAAFARSTQVDASRTVHVIFDANPHGPWRFRPMQASVDVHPGELTTVVYEIGNQQDRDMAGQAIPSYAPQEAVRYFKKIECFCFSQQQLKAHETRQFPVVFVIDPKLPADVSAITLSYTFFEVGEAAGGNG